MEKNFVFPVYPGVSLITLAGVIEIYEQAQLEELHEFEETSYCFSLFSTEGSRTPSYFDVGLETRGFADAQDMEIDTLFVSGGLGYTEAMQDESLLSFLRKYVPRARRICASGTGTFILAAAGLLDGKRVVTHWLMNDEFAESFPKIQLERNILYLQDGNLWTAAGMGAIIDFALALLEEEVGRTSAFRVAERVVVPIRRSGHQPQQSSLLHSQALEGDRLDQLHEWIRENLDAELSVDVLANRVAMSSRNFSRIYSEKMGITPTRAITQFRIEAAHDALLHSEALISTIAYRCGFGSEQNMRRAFLRALGRTPTEIREESERD